MKKALQRALDAVTTRSDVSDRVDALKAESRAENARLIAKGKGWEGLKQNGVLLGLSVKDGQRPKMEFGSRKNRQ